MSRRGEEIRDSFMNRIISPACGTMKVPFEDFLFVFRLDTKSKLTLTDRTAENIHQRASHFSSSLRSMIWVISGPVEIRATGQLMSSSACLMKSFAFFVSFA